eukprot:scpid30886/ scgid11244/ 
MGEGTPRLHLAALFAVAVAMMLPTQSSTKFSQSKDNFPAKNSLFDAGIDYMIHEAPKTWFKLSALKKTGKLKSVNDIMTLVQAASVENLGCSDASSTAAISDIERKYFPAASSEDSESASDTAAHVLSEPLGGPVWQIRTGQVVQKGTPEVQMVKVLTEVSAETKTHCSIVVRLASPVFTAVAPLGYGQHWETTATSASEFYTDQTKNHVQAQNSKSVDATDIEVMFLTFEIVAFEALAIYRSLDYYFFPSPQFAITRPQPISGSKCHDAKEKHPWSWVSLGYTKCFPTVDMQGRTTNFTMLVAVCMASDCMHWDASGQQCNYTGRPDYRVKCAFSVSCDAASSIDIASSGGVDDCDGEVDWQWQPSVWVPRWRHGMCMMMRTVRCIAPGNRHCVSRDGSKCKSIPKPLVISTCTSESSADGETAYQDNDVTDGVLGHDQAYPEHNPIIAALTREVDYIDSGYHHHYIPMHRIQSLLIHNITTRRQQDMERVGIEDVSQILRNWEQVADWPADVTGRFNDVIGIASSQFRGFNVVHNPSPSVLQVIIGVARSSDAEHVDMAYIMAYAMGAVAEAFADRTKRVDCAPKQIRDYPDSCSGTRVYPGNQCPPSSNCMRMREVNFQTNCADLISTKPLNRTVHGFFQGSPPCKYFNGVCIPTLPEEKKVIDFDSCRNAHTLGLCRRPLTARETVAIRYELDSDIWPLLDESLVMLSVSRRNII